MRSNRKGNSSTDTPAQDCIWRGLLHHETPPAHPSASLWSLRGKKKRKSEFCFEIFAAINLL